MKDSLISKAESNYKVAGDGEPMCGACTNFISPDACKLVSGTISEKGTCDLFAPQDVEAALFGGANG